MKINVKSVITSGLVSGLIISLIGICMVPLVGNDMDVALASRCLPTLSNMAMVYFSMMPLVNGIFLMLLYAVAQKLFGSSIKTILIVSLIYWFLTYFSTNVSMVVYGFLPIRLTIIGTAWGLGELIIAGIVGSKIYKEIK